MDADGEVFGVLEEALAGRILAEAVGSKPRARCRASPSGRRACPCGGGLIGPWGPVRVIGAVACASPEVVVETVSRLMVPSGGGGPAARRVS